uniref:Type III restriction-modification system methylation subunit n=1 Tax=Vibrio sp. F12 FF_152 TaxID=1652829 RepID=A0A0H3ZPU5_9VIBR|nr:Type III restriction-modification system methylation subunit [Vibrio sp. F12 FF_152]
MPPSGRYWVFNEEEVKRRITDGRIIFGKTGNAAPIQKNIYQKGLANELKLVRGGILMA